MEDLLGREALRQLVALPEKVNDLEACFRKEISSIQVGFTRLEGQLNTSLMGVKTNMKWMLLLVGLGSNIIGGIIVTVIAKGL